MQRRARASYAISFYDLHTQVDGGLHTFAILRKTNRHFFSYILHSDMLPLPYATKENYKVLLYRLADLNADKVSYFYYTHNCIHRIAVECPGRLVCVVDGCILLCVTAAQRLDDNTQIDTFFYLFVFNFFLVLSIQFALHKRYKLVTAICLHHHNFDLFSSGMEFIISVILIYVYDGSACCNDTKISVSLILLFETTTSCNRVRLDT